MSREEERKNAQDDGQALVQMYQAGFFDGYEKYTRKKIRWNFIKLDCIKAFEKRFKKQLNKKIIITNGKNKAY